MQEYFVYFKFLQRICEGKVLGVPAKAQQSGFGGERRSSGATELLPSKGRNEGCKACDDAARRRNCAVLPQAYCTPNVRKSLSNFGGKSKEIFDFSVK